jgi:cobalt-zinc-cadmium resistance protein CzcA
MRFNELISGARQDVVIKIFGEELQQLDDYAQQVGAAIRQVPGIHDMYQERATGQAQIVATIRRERLAEYGLSVEAVNQAIAAGFAGAKTGQVFEKERRFDLVVRFQADFRANLDQVRQIFVPTPDGRQVPLDQLADVRLVSGPSQIQRDDAKRRILVGFNVRGRDVQSVVHDVQAQIGRQVHFKPGYYTTYGGQFENLATALQRLLIAVPIALLLIFVLLYATFGSFGQVALISTAIPLSAIGGVVALWLRDMPFSISAGVGFIALFGVAVLNGIVLIGYFNKLKKDGVADLRTRILEGAAVRLRPVLMTAAVASLGFLPMALATSAGAEAQKPLATVVIGGLVSSTLLTLLVLPILYYLAEKGFGKKRVPENGEKATQGGKPALLALILLAGCFLLSTKSVFAQAQTPYLTESQAIAEAIAQNSTILAAQELLVAQQAQILLAKEPGRPSLQTSYGQYNTVNKDIIFNISQPLAWPGYFRAAMGVAQAQTLSRELQVKIAKAEVRRQVRIGYLSAAYYSSLAGLLQGQDSIYAQFLKAAQARLRSGETAQLEPSTAIVLSGESGYRIRQARTQNRIALASIGSLLQSSSPFRLQDSLLSPIEDVLIPNVMDTATAESFLLAKALARQIDIARTQVQFAKTQNKPSITIGYLNQSLIGNQIVHGAPRDYDIGYRFQGVNLAFTLPIWMRAQRARVLAASASQRAAEASYKRILYELANQFSALRNQHTDQQKRLDFYKQTGLPEATRIVTLARKAYLAGENSFSEYLLHVERAFRIRQDYLDLVHQHNQTLIEIEYLITPAQ